MTLTRSVTPSGTVDGSDLVRVDLRIKFGSQASAGCAQVTELVPSGLAPVGSLATWIDPDNEEARPDPSIVLPYDPNNIPPGLGVTDLVPSYWDPVSASASAICSAPSSAGRGACTH